MSGKTDLQFGLHAVLSVLEQDPKRVRDIIILKDRKDQRIQKVIDAARQQAIKIRFLPRTDFERLLKNAELTDARHQGVIAQCTALEILDEGDLESLLHALNEPALLVVLDGVTDPHNLGAVLRTADAAGAHAVIAPKDKSASLNATAIKVACGAAEKVPFVQVTNLARTLKHLQQSGIWIIGTAGEASESLHQAKLTGPMALVMGAEGDGMRRLTRDTCDGLIHIPMKGSVSSLNVSVATGICLFEVVRQRGLQSA